MRFAPNISGILCISAGIAIFSVQDLILKLLSATYPLSEAMVFRSLTALPFMLIITRVYDGSLKTLWTPHTAAMLARGLLNFTAYTAYYLALAALPMPTTVALYITAPLIITVLAVVVLREAVSWPRWGGVMAGFVGVVLIIQPGGDLFDWAALLPIFCAFAYGASMILARSMGTTSTAAAMAFWGNVAFLLCALALSAWFGAGNHQSALHPSLAFLTRGWVTPLPFDLVLMSACGLIAAVGLTLLTEGYRIGQSAVVAPFEFTFIFWGLLWGWLFWGDLPDALGWVGIVLIIGSGLYVLHREGQEGARMPRANPDPAA